MSQLAREKDVIFFFWVLILMFQARGSVRLFLCFTCNVSSQ